MSNRVSIDGFVLKKSKGNSDYFQQYSVFNDGQEIGFIKFDDGYFTASFLGKEIYHSKANSSKIPGEISKALSEIKTSLLERFVQEFCND